MATTLRRKCGLGCWIGLELNQTLFTVQTMTAGWLPGHIANTTFGRLGSTISNDCLTSLGAPEWPSRSLSTNDLTIDNVPGAPPPEDTPDKETMDPQKPDLTCTPDLTKMKALMQVVGVDIAGGNAYGKATGLYNEHCKYSEYWNPWHPFQSAHDFQVGQSSSQQKKTCKDQHLRHGLDNFKTESFQLADALRKSLSQLNSGLGDDICIDDHSHIFGTL